MKNVEFDYKHDLYDPQVKYRVIADQFVKAYIWYHENLRHMEQTLKGDDKGKVTVLDITLELTGDELEFVKTALANEYKRRF